MDSGRYYSWKKQLAETGSVKHQPAAKRERKIDKEKLLQLIKEHPDWYLKEFADVFNVCHQAIQQMFKKLGVTRKKTFTYSGKSEEKRKEYLKQVAQIPEEKRVYVDECGIKEHLKCEFGRAHRGVKVEDVSAYMPHADMIFTG